VAKAAVESAESVQAQAKLALGRTSLSAPFNAIVQSENVDVGQLVSPASQLAVLVGTDAYWVQLSVPVEQLAWIDVPGLNADKKQGSAARVWQEIGGARVERPGQVIRLLGDLDPVGRMARVLVQIDDPLRLKENGQRKVVPTEEKPAAAKALPSAEKLPFLIGAYVNVEVEARQVQVPVVEIPRLALRDGSQVYVYGASDKLEIRKVNIVWRSKDSVLVRAGVKPGELVITSRLAGAVPGMRLRKHGAAEGKALGKR
jgi:multidrug efflux pump subunit AcrA (membrane-fusion protein)